MGHNPIPCTCNLGKILTRASDMVAFKGTGQLRKIFNKKVIYLLTLSQPSNKNLQTVLPCYLSDL